MTISKPSTIRTSLNTFFALAEKLSGTTAGKHLAKQWAGKIALLLAGTAATATSANALNINPSYSSEMDLDTTQLIEEIATTWEQELKDPITINLNFSFSDALPTGILGGSKPAMIKVKYKDYLTALGQDGLSEDDVLAVQTKLTDIEDQDLYAQYLAGSVERKKFKVKETKTFDLLIDEIFLGDGSSEIDNGKGKLDNNGNKNNQKIWLTRSNAKALNFLKADDKKLDANIVLSSAVNWDMDASDGVAADAYDFRTVVLHEIGHALGFVSGADAMEYLRMTSNGSVTDDDLSYITPLSTYTYSDESAVLGVNDVRLGQGIEKYMSLDGGTTQVTDSQSNIAFFSTGGLNLGGDGYQTSHWKDSTPPLGIMNPSLQMGQSIAISELDLRLLDVIGWDLTNRSKRLMEETGLDWEGFQAALKMNHQTVVDLYGDIWETHNPGDSIKEELKAELWDLYKDIEGDIEEKLLKLKSDLANEDDPVHRQDDREATIAKIWDLIEHQDDDLKHFADDMKDVNVKVRDWLDEDVNKLADLLRVANRVQIHKLQRILDRAREEERLVWENKLRQALALFLPNPDAALATITKTNDFHNPMGGGSGSSGTGGGWWGGWWSSSVTDDADSNLDLNFYNTASIPTSDAQTTQTQSVPEPSAIISLVALGGMGLLTRKRR